MAWLFGQYLWHIGDTIAKKKGKKKSDNMGQKVGVSLGVLRIQLRRY